MARVQGEHYPWTRVGYRKPVPRGEAPPPFYVEDGTMVVRFDAAPLWATAAERAAKKARVPCWKFGGYPIPVTEDTEFVDCNFSQEEPHTAIFDVAPGVVVTFVDCTGVNVTAPDGAVIKGGNWRHQVTVATGDKDHPFTNLLCECEKCATFRAELSEALDEIEREHEKGKADGTLRDGERYTDDCFDGTAVCHHALKERVKARREVPEMVEADREEQAAANDAVLAKHGVMLSAGQKAALGRK